MSNGDKDFDIAVCIDSKAQYKNVLHTDIKFEMKTQFLHFTHSQQYIKGDINTISEACNFVQEIDTERYVKAFLKNSNDISNSFSSVSKIQLFRFKDGLSKVWTQYLSKQTLTHSNIVVIVNDKNQPIYMLTEADVSILNESIKFKQCLPYQPNDIKVLNSFAIKMKTFFCNNKWKIAIKNTAQTFKNGICYNFVNEKVKKEFFNQSFDVGLVTNSANQMCVLLSDVTYVRSQNCIQFKSDILYKNGIYQKIKECGTLQKSMVVKQYRIETDQTANVTKKYSFNKVKEPNFVPNKCLLFSIKEIEAWVDFIHTHTNEFHDIGIITNTDDIQIYFVNKVHVDGDDNTINFGGSEPFSAKHNDLIYKFGAFVKAISLKGYSVPGLDSDKGELKNMNCYTWDMNKKATERKIVPISITPAASYDDQFDESKTHSPNGNRKRGRKGKSKSEMPANLSPKALEDRPKKKGKGKKKKGLSVKKKGRSKSEMPAGVSEVSAKRQRGKGKGKSENKSRGSKKQSKLEIKGKKKGKKPNKKSKSALPTRAEADSMAKSSKGKKKAKSAKAKVKAKDKREVKKPNKKSKSALPTRAEADSMVKSKGKKEKLGNKLGTEKGRRKSENISKTKKNKSEGNNTLNVGYATQNGNEEKGKKKRKKKTKKEAQKE